MSFVNFLQRSTDSLSTVSVTVAACAIQFIKLNTHFALAFVMTAVFYLPALLHGSVDAGFLYMGDVIGFYLPMIAKTQSLISSLNFTAIDFSAFNGSSDFYLAANFFAVHPMVVLYSLVFPAESTTLVELGQFLVLMCAVHSFLACYFASKLFTRFFSFGFGVAAVTATVFAFNIHMVSSLGEPEFIFSVSILPWAVYSALNYVEAPNLRRLVIGCLPVLFGILGGYIPLGVATIAIAVALVASKILWFDAPERPLEKRLNAFFQSLMPFAGATLIAAPYLYSVHQFMKDSPGAIRPSLFFSAHQMAEQPQSLLRLISAHYSVPGPFAEFSMLWGFIACVIAALFILSKQAMGVLSQNDWKLFKIAVLLYFTTALSIFGEFSVVSDLVYYLIPQIGTMHIYQRFLLPMHLFFAVAIALMLQALATTRPPIATKVALAVFAAATLAAAHFGSRDAPSALKIGLDNYIVFELALGFLFTLALTMPGNAFLFGVTLVLLCLPALDKMYDYSHGGNALHEKRKHLVIALDETERGKLVAYLKRFGDKAIIKYVDVTPRWTREGNGIESFPKSFPYFTLNELQLSSYSGFNFYLSARADYSSKMPIVGQQVVLEPDWATIFNTGADFLVALASDVDSGSLNGVLARVKKEDFYKLPNGVVIVPLRPKAAVLPSMKRAVIDNGYFKISPWVVHDEKKLVNIAAGKPARQSSTYDDAVAQKAVDGNTDGDYNHGSVSHTGRDPHAWLEVDLGTIEIIDSLKVWNRTDCCGNRLRDYWVFISEVPFSPNDTASLLRERLETWGQINYTPNPKGTIVVGGIRGRYVRIQLGGTLPPRESHLNLAEVQIFRSEPAQVGASAANVNASPEIKITGFTTNNANYLRLDMESSVPASVEYLFSENPRLSYYINGERTIPINAGGLPAINTPTGRSTIEIRYRHWPLTLFWAVYALYAFSLCWVSLPSTWQTKFTRLLVAKWRVLVSKRSA